MTSKADFDNIRPAELGLVFLLKIVNHLMKDMVFGEKIKEQVFPFWEA